MAETATSLALTKSIRMQIQTEKAIINVSRMLKLIREVRGQVLLHDCDDIKKETKERTDNVKRENEAVIDRLKTRHREAERIIEEALSTM